MKEGRHDMWRNFLLLAMLGVMVATPSAAQLVGVTVATVAIPDLAG
jgi:hypothetical protein